MLAAQELGLRTMNGHSRVVPPGFIQSTQCGDIISMARAYEEYVPGFRFENVRRRILVSPAGLNCAPTWDRLLHPLPASAAMPVEYRASFEIRCLNCPTRVNEVAQFVVDVKNASARAWPLLPLGLSGRFVRADTNEAVSNFETRVYLGQVVEAGGTAPLVLALKGPAQPGDYVLETDMVHENVAWFSDTGQTVKGRFPLHVSPPPQPRPRLITPARIW
jgi:hypothetical protein